MIQAWNEDPQRSDYEDNCREFLKNNDGVCSGWISKFPKGITLPYLLYLQILPLSLQRRPPGIAHFQVTNVSSKTVPRVSGNPYMGTS